MQLSEQTIAAVDTLTQVASYDGNARRSEYLRGIANGAILIHAVIHGKVPKFIDDFMDPEAPDVPEEVQTTLNHIIDELGLGGA